MIIDRDFTDRLVGLVRTPRVTDVKVGVVEDGRLPYRRVSYYYDGDIRNLRVDIDEYYGDDCRFEVWENGWKGNLGYDISEEFRNVWSSKIQFPNGLRRGYASIMLPFFHAFLLEQGCKGYEVGVNFRLQGDELEKAQAGASEKLFRRQFVPVEVRSNNGVIKECWGVV